MDRDAPSPVVQLVEDEDASVRAAASSRHEVAFIDSGVDGFELLVSDLQTQQDAGRPIEIVLLDGDRDGIEQITQAMTRYEDVSALHVISHGSDGVLQLGSSRLEAPDTAGRAKASRTVSTMLSVSRPQSFRS